MTGQRPQFRELDALRCLAAFAVICFHISIHLQFPRDSFHTISKGLLSLGGAGGAAGVRFFFVLSGFLITYLMLDEQRKTGTFSPVSFYARRVLRIWPLYYAVLLAGFVCLPLLLATLGAPYREQARPVMYASFLTNFDFIYNAMPSHEVLVPLWSVAIEEQFYLFWPLVFLIAGRRRIFPCLLVGMVIGSSVFEASYFGSDVVGQYHPLCAAGDLAMGALCAYACFHYRSRVERCFQRMSGAFIALVYAAGVAMVIHWCRPRDITAVGQVLRPVESTFFAFVILEQTFALRSPCKASSLPWATGLGKASYGLYLVHMWPITFVHKAAQHVRMNVWVQAVAAIGMTVAISVCSYRYFERPFLSLKERFSPPDR